MNNNKTLWNQAGRAIAAALAGVTLTLSAGAARAAINVVTTTPELAAITKEVGGNLVSVTSLAKPQSGLP